MKKIAQYPRLVFFLIFLVLYGITFLVGLKNGMLRTIIAVTISFVLSPKQKKFKTQTGTKTQITWFLLKEPIVLD